MCPSKARFSPHYYHHQPDYLGIDPDGTSEGISGGSSPLPRTARKLRCRVCILDNTAFKNQGRLRDKVSAEKGINSACGRQIPITTEKVFSKDRYFLHVAGQKGGWSRLAKNLKAEIDQELIELYRGAISLPFEIGDNKRIAVKMVGDWGIESLKILEVQ